MEKNVCAKKSHTNQTKGEASRGLHDRSRTSISCNDAVQESRTSLENTDVEIFRNHVYINSQI